MDMLQTRMASMRIFHRNGAMGGGMFTCEDAVAAPKPVRLPSGNLTVRSQQKASNY